MRLNARTAGFCILILLAVSALFLVHPASTGLAREDSRPGREKTIFRQAVRAAAKIFCDHGQGTGWVVDRKKKQLVTAEHVVRDEDQVFAIFAIFRDGRVETRRDAYKEAKPVPGKVILADARRDLALIELERLPADAAELALADEVPEPGESVRTVGCSGAGLAFWEYSEGRVRSVTTATWTDDTRQRRDARIVESQVPINPGDSGGPLLNDSGEVVGVNSAFRTNGQIVSVHIDVAEVRWLLAESSNPSAATRSAKFLKAARRFKDERNLKEIIGNLQKAIQLDDQNGKALVEMAWACNESSDHENAVKWAKQALALERDNSDGWRELGRARLFLGEERAACEALRRALKSAPHDATAWDYLALALARLEQPEAAEEARRAAEAARAGE